jgi:hypothetical protein
LRTKTEIAFILLALFAFDEPAVVHDRKSKGFPAPRKLVVSSAETNRQIFPSI